MEHCKQNFDNKHCGVMMEKQMKEEKVDNLTFVQALFKVVQQQCNKRENNEIVNGQMNLQQGKNLETKHWKPWQNH